jgi:hypothetical protein
MCDKNLSDLHHGVAHFQEGKQELVFEEAASQKVGCHVVEGVDRATLTYI